MKYRAEIDGLRALAVVPVILYHAGATLFSGGFVGVDIFFVISGYLITTIIVNDLDANKFSIVNFYERRARRILPALLCVVLVCAVAAWFLLGPIDGGRFAKSILGVITFTSNIVFWRDGGYFESTSELKPLLHTWSLAVEEQFYVFFPLLMAVTFRFARKYVAILLIAIALISFALTEWAVILNAGHAGIVYAGYYLLPTRSWELLIGSLVVFYLKRNKAELPLAARNILGLAGGGMILWAIFSFDEHTAFPSHFALLPTLGTALIILYATSGTLTKALLGSRVLVAIGLGSYSAYLWHQPVLAFYRYYTGTNNIDPQALAGLIALVAALAFFTWKFIEQPFRNKSTFSRRAIFSFSLGASATAGLLAFVLLVATSNSERHLARFLSENEFIYFGNMDERVFTLDRLAYDNNNPTALLMGSSRLMEVGSNIIGQEALNLSVSGASIEDIVAILGAAKTRYSVDKIYIGIDPWLFNDDAGQNRWLTIADQYHAAVADIEGRTEVLAQTPNVDGRTITEATASRIQALYYKTKLFDIAAPDGSPGNQLKRSRDGRMVDKAGSLGRPYSQIEAAFDELLKYSMVPYTPSTKRRTLFEMLIRSLHGYDVSLVLSPYHPALYTRIIRENPIVATIEDDFRAVAKQLGVRVLGSYDPNRVGCVAADFFDGMHPDATCMQKVFVDDTDGDPTGTSDTGDL